MGIATITSVCCLENLPRIEKRLDVLLQYQFCLYNKEHIEEIQHKQGKRFSYIFYKLIFRSYTTLHQGYETVMRDDV